MTDELLQSARLTEAEARLEVAVTLFQQERITLGKAAALAGIGQLEFQKALACRRIPIHYGLEEWKQDAEYLKRQSGQ